MGVGVNFSFRAKEEISGVPLFSRRAKIALLSAIIHTAGSVVVRGGDGSLALVFENASDLTLSVLHKLLNELYNLNDIKRDGKLLIIEGGFFDKMMQECCIFKLNNGGERDVIPGIDSSLLKGEGTAAAYIRGMFLGSGSISLNSGYHLEFVVSNTVFMEDLITLLKGFSILAKHAVGKRGFVVYLKGHQAVSDVLALMGASLSVMEINNRFAGRMVKQLANRRMNCDLANIDKTVETANRQCDAIMLLKECGEFETLETRLKEAAQARLENPDASLEELGQILNISKSGVRHRLSKLMEISSKHN